MQTLARIRSLKNPSLNRRLGPLGCTIAVLLFGGAASAAPDGPLQEADVIRLARASSPAAIVSAATGAFAEARTRTAGRFANPSLSWVRETVQTGAGSAEDIVSARLPISIMRPLTTRSLAASSGAWMRAQAAQAKSEAVLQALLMYYEATLAAQRIEVLKSSVANLDEAARVLAHREAVGSASGYESTRLSIERELGRSRLRRAEDQLKVLKAQLVAQLGLPPGPIEIAANLVLLSTANQAALAERGWAAREAVKQAKAAQRLASEATGRAGWAWLPTLQLQAGLKHVDQTGGGYGYVAGVSLGLPLFDYGQALKAQAEAQHNLSTARADALSRTFNSELLSAMATLSSARTELQRFESKTSQPVKALLAAAHSGYREGERSIVELLDAQRAQTEVAQRRLTLLGAAKRAEARLRAATGDLQ